MDTKRIYNFSDTRIAIPRPEKNVLCVDFHYVNGVTVFHSISRKVDYITVSFPTSQSKNSIISELKEI